MLRKTKSLLEELDTLYLEKDKAHILESRASNIIASAIRLVEQIETSYGEDEAENLTRKLLNSIKARDPERFMRALRRTDEDS